MLGNFQVHRCKASWNLPPVIRAGMIHSMKIVTISYKYLTRALFILSKGKVARRFSWRKKNSFKKHSPAVIRVGFITYHFLGCFADWRVPRSNILLHLHPSWSLEHEAGISKHNRGLKLSAALASTTEAWSSGQIMLEKQKLYRLALLPPSRLAAFLNTSEFSAR